MGENRGSIAFFGTYRPPVPLDIFSCPADPPPCSAKEELLLTDDVSYNQNGHPVPAAALKEILTFLWKKNPSLAAERAATVQDATEGRVTGMVFVSERDSGLETLHLALRFNSGKVNVLSLADIYGSGTFGGVRMEDSGCIAGGFTVQGPRGSTTVGHSLVYVSTKKPVKARRTPWTVVYRTDLADGKTERLTPPGQYDLSPAVSPNGKMVAVANFTGNRWEGAIENLKTNIQIMNVDKRAQGRLDRIIVIEDGGWPTWGSDNVLFFHRGLDEKPHPTNTAKWSVFRYDITRGGKPKQVTPDDIDAMTPAAISETKVAVATIRKKSKQVVMMVDRDVEQYRHIEIFDTTTPLEEPPVKITQRMRPHGDHYNPFVLDGGRRIGYHRCRTDKMPKVKSTGRNAEMKTTTILQRKFDRVQPPPSHADVGLFRVTGVFPSISKDGKKLAFVDNEFKSVWLADTQGGLRVVYNVGSDTSVFSTSWNQNDDLDTLYVCEGPAFTFDSPVQIVRIPGVSTIPKGQMADSFPLTGLYGDEYNCAFPSTNFEGTKLVFRSSWTPVDGGDEEKLRHKNLYVMDAKRGELDGVHQLTDGANTDTHCSWSPVKGCDWIVFSSHRDKPLSAGNVKDHGLDPGFFAVYLVDAKGIENRKGGPLPTPVRVIYSATSLAGHVNHPVFSPNMESIVFTADLAAVSADPISMPHFTHSVRPYGDIFSVNLRDKGDITKNRDIKDFDRITHSRYEYSTPTWAGDNDEDPNAKWKMLENVDDYTPVCPYTRGRAGEQEGWHMTGHLTLKKRPV